MFRSVSLIFPRFPFLSLLLFLMRNRGKRSFGWKRKILFSEVLIQQGMYRKLVLENLSYFFSILFFSIVFLLFCFVIVLLFLCNIDEKDSSEVLIQQGMYRKQRPPHVVLLKLPAQYGSEAVLKKIYQHSGKAHWKIHVR